MFLSRQAIIDQTGISPEVFDALRDDGYLTPYHRYHQQRNRWTRDAVAFIRKTEVLTRPTETHSNPTQGDEKCTQPVHNSDIAPRQCKIADRALALLKARPRDLSDLADALDLSPSRTRTLLDSLADSHAITITEENVCELRCRDIMAPAQVKNPWGGASEQKFLVVSDTHWGNVHAKVRSLQRAYEYAQEQGCTFALHCGDLFDGSPNMHKGFVFELGLPEASEQLEFGVAEYPVNIPTLIIDGNHDLSFHKDNGFSIIKHFAAEVNAREGRDVIRRAGVRMALIPGPTGEPNCLCLKHPDGGKSYGRTYKAQKTAEWMHDAITRTTEEAESVEGPNYPQLTLIGHYHATAYFRQGLSHFWMLPSMCEMTAFQQDKELYNEAGFIVFTAVFNDNGRIIRLKPDPIPLPPGDEIVYERRRKKIVASMAGAWAA